MTMASVALANEPPPTGLVIALAPLPGSSGQIDTLDVTLRFDTLDTKAGAPAVALTKLFNNVDTKADEIGTIEATDRSGTVTLTGRDRGTAGAGEDADNPTREWTAPRALQGPVKIHYRVSAVTGGAPRGPAPPLSFRNDDHAFSGSSSLFLVRPPANRSYTVKIAWDLSALPKGARGVSSFGEGNVSAPEPLDRDQLGNLFFMGGEVTRGPASSMVDGFSATWQGHPAFDAAALATWTSQLHQKVNALFNAGKPAPYNVFLRFNPVNAGGGVALQNSFVGTYGAGDGSNLEYMKLLLSHEMFHTYQPTIDKPTEDAFAWWAEGTAVLYQARLPLRFGMITPEQYLKDINFTAARYYTNVLGNLPNQAIVDGFWADTRIRTLAYDRGMLYLVTVDDALRKRSSGKRSLDTLLFAMLRQRASGNGFSQDDFEALLRKELGEPAVRDFHAFMAGATPVPASDAFGPCFRRTTKPLRRYVLGFEPKVLAEPKRIVRGLIPDSAAAKAGLLNGDAIVRPVPQDGIQGNQTELLHLRIRRGEKEFDLSYLPRGETVDAWQWERVTGVPDSACGL